MANKYNCLMRGGMHRLLDEQLYREMEAAGCMDIYPSFAAARRMWPDGVIASLDVNVRADTPDQAFMIVNPIWNVALRNVEISQFMEGAWEERHLYDLGEVIRYWHVPVRKVYTIQQQAVMNPLAVM